MSQRPLAFAEAPGKIIITGEHFVVHGGMALAIALNKTVKASAKIAESNRIISTRFKTVQKSPKPRNVNPVFITIENTLKYLRSTEKVGITLESDIPNASGLGSSSAVAVATVAAIMRLFGRDIDQEIIFNLAMESERIIHGNPSGVDVAVATHGGGILFRRGIIPTPILKPATQLEIVVGVSGIKRKTSRMIEMFSKVRSDMPSYFGAMVRSSDFLTGIAVDAIESGNMEHLGAVMNFYNSVLSFFGIGTRETDRMIEICLSEGALGAKITGGGGGGSIIAVAPPQLCNKVVEAIRANGLDAFLFRVPQPGVRSWKEE